MTATVYKMAAAGDDAVNLDAPKYSFDDFWRAYPRRVARKDAEKAWFKVDASNHAKIFAAVAASKRTDDWKKNGGQYIPYPASYLRGERWLDEIDADLSMGQCCWNINGNRGPGGRCPDDGVTEKNGQPYCRKHADLL